MGPGGSCRMRTGEMCKCENEGNAPQSGYSRAPQSPALRAARSCGPTPLAMTYTHSHTVTRVPAPRGRALSRPVYTPSQCHTLPVTLTLTESHTVSHAVSHTPESQFLPLSAGSLAPSRDRGAAWELPFLRSGFGTPDSQVPQFNMTSRLSPPRGLGRVF